jgi:hypothetical protein
MTKADIEQRVVVRDSKTYSYTYSVWLYVNSWQITQNDKVIIRRGGAIDNTPTTMPSLSINLDKSVNNLKVLIGCANRDTPFMCNVDNIPLQKWTNLIVSLSQRVLDIYLDGKLVKTCYLPEVAIAPSGDVIMCPKSDSAILDGWISNSYYMNKETNPQDAYNIYKSGYNSSSLNLFLNKFNIKVSILSNNQEKKSITF